VTNMYESVVWVSWGVVLFSLLLFIAYRSRYLWIASAAVAAFGLVLADNLPADAVWRASDNSVVAHALQYPEHFSRFV